MILTCIFGAMKKVKAARAVNNISGVMKFMIYCNIRFNAQLGLDSSLALMKFQPAESVESC